MKKKKKPFYKRGWFIILAIIAAIAIINNVAGRKSDKSEKIEWTKMELGSRLSTPDAKKGKIWTNTEEKLWVKLNKIREDEYKDYMSACKKLGYTVDADTTSFSYNAYNKEGYKLYISFISDEMSIELEAPMKFSTIQWPSSTVGKLLPTPKSTSGKFSYEHDTSFAVYIGDTTQEDFKVYVTACSEKGFNVDYDKGDTYYYADNADGYHISLRYEGNNIMWVDISSPDKDDSPNTTKTTGKQEESEKETSEPTVSKESKSISSPGKDESPDATKVIEKQEESKKEDTGLLDPDFKAAMDSYEEFMDEYVAFMKKYSANPSDLGLLVDYANYMSKYAEFTEEFDKWEEVDMNTEEIAYYLEVQTRIYKKLLEVAQ